MNPTLTLFGATYCIDSCVLLDIWKSDGRYPMQVFPSVWQHIENLINQGTISSSIEVYDELKDDDNPEFVAWLKSKRTIFLPVDDSQLPHLKEIVCKYPELTNGKRNNADPCLVALAKSLGASVITSEKYQPSASPTKPKIPNLCEEFGVTSLTLLDFLQEQKIAL
jgi:hypothetical protein